MNAVYKDKLIRSIIDIKPSLYFLMLVIVLLTQSCATARNEDKKAQTLHVELSEWSIKTDRGILRPGKIRFQAMNQGTVPHEMVVVKTDVPVDGFKIENGRVEEDAAGEVMGEIESFQPGSVQTLTLDLSEGSYVLFCNNMEADEHEGHYQKGMRISLEVKPVGS